MNSKSRLFFLFVVGLYLNSNAQANDTITQKISIPDWQVPTGVTSTKVLMGYGKTERTGWGKYSPNERLFYNEVLPSVFLRTLIIDSMNGDRGIKWIFTGPKEGFYLEVSKNRLTFYKQYYDSYGFNSNKKIIPGYPASDALVSAITTNKTISAVSVELNYKLGLIISLNGKAAINETFIEDIRRNQIHLTGINGSMAGRMLEPETIKEIIHVDPNTSFQQMIGWGGICTPTAYNELSEAGKTKWWQYISEYNLLCQREYPVGSLLNEKLDNWDDLRFAKAHYYGDNFPNGEVSDFNYNRKMQDLGGFVMFEFWNLPEWIGNSEKEYVRAIVGYCTTALKKTGKAPRIVGIQNEIDMSEDRIKRFVPALRKALDEAGFKEIKIHMANASTVKAALERVDKYVNNTQVWNAIDYSATNMYDYQSYFTNPDGFDTTLLSWDSKIKSRAFISTELCINDNKYQTGSYRLAFNMGQLYHKNLTLTNAVLIAYCWTLLNVEQPSFGASRSLFVSSPENGFMPVPSSDQLRVFGAYSRRIKEGMKRVFIQNNNNDLKVVAFKGENNAVTMVILNRSLNPVEAEIDWKNISFSEMETVDPYSPNLVSRFTGKKIKIMPGAIRTITNVPLNEIKN